MNWVYWMRLLNVILAGFVAGLCFLKADWLSQDKVRLTRIMGLGLLCVAIGWGSFARRFDTFRPWLPLVTIGLFFCLYGMRRVAAGERTTRM